jgi:hypothetical protein
MTWLKDVQKDIHRLNKKTKKANGREQAYTVKDSKGLRAPNSQGQRK